MRRADILRKAEYLVQRLLEPKADAGPKSRAVSVSSGKNVGASGDASDVEREEAKDEAKDEEEGEEEGKADGGDGVAEEEGKEDAGTREASPMGSVHEADESDLSDVPSDGEKARQEEEAKRTLLFPNLRRGSGEGSKGRQSEEDGGDD